MDPLTHSHPYSKDLTIQQQALWFLAYCNPQDTRYNIGLALRVAGTLDHEALSLAMRRLVARTPILRTTFHHHSGVPWQKQHENLPPPIDMLDLSGQAEAELKKSIQSWYHQSFDLSSHCLRLGIFQIGRQEHVLVVCAHHIIADFTSLCLILDQLEILYLMELGEEDHSWLQACPSFSDYCQDEARQPSEQDMAYWASVLNNPPPPLNWHGIWRQGPSSSHKSVYFDLNPEQTQGIKNRAEEARSSVFVVLLAAWAVAVAQETDQHDVMVGVPTSMRDAGFQHTLGSLFTMLPLRAQIEDVSFAALIQDVRTHVFSALEHRRAHFSQFLHDVAGVREETRNPLFQTTVNMLGHANQSRWLHIMLAPSSTKVMWAGLHASSWELNQQEGQVDVALECVETDQNIRCIIKADDCYFSSHGLQLFVRCFEHTLGCLLDHPHASIWPLLQQSKREGNRCIFSPDGSPQRLGHETSLISWFDRQALSYPHRVAIREGNEVLDYQILQQYSLCLAQHLAAIPSDPGLAPRVGMLLPAGIHAIMAMLGIMRHGSAYVPLGPSWPVERLRRIIKQAQIHIIITQGQYDDLDPSSSLRYVDIHACAPPKHGTPIELSDNSTASGLAYSVFTSGSTGEPKGIDVEHRQVLALLESMFDTLELTPDVEKVWSWCHAMSFDLSVWEIWGALCSAGSLLVVPEAWRGQADRVWSLWQQEQVNIITQTPSGLKNILPIFQQQAVLSSAQHWVICGEALPSATARHYLSEHWTLWNMYGPAECTVFSSIEKVTATSLLHDIVPLGRPLTCASVCIDPAHHTPVLGLPGEIIIGGLGVARGYVGLDQKTQASFVSGSLGMGRVYKTGDTGYWDGKRLHFCGRKDQQIKLHGHRIEPLEIEQCLEHNDNIKHAVIFLDHHPDFDRLVAVIQWHNDHNQDDEQTLRSYLHQYLPAYMVPTHMLFVDRIPHNRHGKIDRLAAQTYWTQRQQQLIHTAHLAKDDSWLMRLSALWCDVLGRGHVGLDEAFFDLGGHSLALMQVHARLQAWPEGRTLLPSDLFRFPTIRLLAEYMQQA